VDLTLYIKLTGNNIPESQYSRYSALIARATAQLEGLLGWSLTPEVLYQEKGKTQNGCVCPDIPESLLPADEVKGIIKVFPYNWKDKFLMTDPYTDVYSAKLVRVLDNREFVTYKTFDLITKQYMANGIGKYIEKCKPCYCDCDCKDCVQLAVDGEWLQAPLESGEESNLPLELLYLLCDMVDYYADPTHDIKSESVDGHSWSKGDIRAPYETERALAILKKYAGPFGSVVRIPTI